MDFYIYLVQRRSREAGISTPAVGAAPVVSRQLQGNPAFHAFALDEHALPSTSPGPEIKRATRRPFPLRKNPRSFLRPSFLSASIRKYGYVSLKWELKELFTQPFDKLRTVSLSNRTKS